jgi:hypothetical protein
VLIFDASMTEMQSRIDEIFRQQERSQFGSNRYALFFKPGKYDLDVQVGFYTQVLGLGRTPDDVAITGAVRADYFWGWGGDAAEQAGRMRQPLRMWVLWPRDGAAAAIVPPGKGR